MNRKSSRICGRNTTTAPTPGDHAVHQQAVQIAGRNQAADDAAEPINAALQGVHRDAREGEDALEHQRHDGQEDERAPDLMRQDAVELVAEGLARGRQFGGDGALDGRDAQVAAFDGRAAPVNAGGIEAAAGGGDGFLDGGGVMLQAGSEGLLVAENEQRFGCRLRAPLVEGPGQQHGNGAGLRLERGRQLGELARFGPGRSLERGKDCLAQFRQPLAGAGDQRQHRHAEFAGQLPGVNLVPILLRHINHVQRNQRRIPQLDHLGGVVEVALQIRGIHHHDDHRGRGQLGQPVEQHVARDLLVERLRAEAVGAGQIQHARVQAGGRAEQPAFFALDRHAGVVADFGAQTGQGVEQRSSCRSSDCRSERCTAATAGPAWRAGPVRRGSGLTAAASAGKTGCAAALEEAGFISDPPNCGRRLSALPCQWRERTGVRGRVPPSQIVSTCSRMAYAFGLHQNLLRFVLAQSQVVAPHLDFDRVAERSKAHQLNRCADQQSHLHQPRAAFGGQFDLDDRRRRA